MVVHNVQEISIELNVYSKSKKRWDDKNVKSFTMLTELMLKNLQGVDILKTSKATIP